MPQTPEEKREKQRLATARYMGKHRDKVNARNRARRKINPEARKARRKELREANLPLSLEKERIQREKNPERRRELQRINRAKNPEERRRKDREAKKKEYEKDPDGFNAKRRERRTKNKDAINERVRIRYQANPAKIMAYNTKHRAAKYNAKVNDFTDAQFEEIKAHYGQRCYYCPSNCWRCARGKHALTQDHIIPLSKGGENTYTNIIPVCKSHNSQKGDRKAPIPVQPLLLIVAPSKPHKRRKR